MPFRVEFHVRTDVGTQRTRNEDSYLVSPKHRLVVIADGMGGHVGGDVASELATASLLDFFDRELGDNHRKSSKRRDGDFLRRAIMEANAAVFERGSSHDDLRDMGTTVVACWFRDDYVIIGSVGDSRVYRLRDHEFTQLTIDHSWVGELRRRRLISDDEALHHPLKNIITRALGMDRKVSVDIFVEELRPTDLYLLCTDGLTDYVDDYRIREIMQESGDDLDVMCDKLVDVANFVAGADNVTVGLAIVGDAEAD